MGESDGSLAAGSSVGTRTKHTEEKCVVRRVDAPHSVHVEGADILSIRMRVVVDSRDQEAGQNEYQVDAHHEAFAAALQYPLSTLAV